MAGLVYCFATQRNMTVHAVIGLTVLVVALALRVSMPEMLILIAAIFAVLVSEMFNSALETVVDLYTREKNELAHIAKDVAAGAVLLTAVFAMLAGAFVFGPRLWQRLFPGS